MPAPQAPPAAYGPDNKLTPLSTFCSPSPSAIAIDPNNSVYDLAGNILCDGVDMYSYGHKYIYDTTNRLAKVYASNALLNSYTYSAEGNRIRKDTAAAGTYQEYAWTGGQVLGEHLSSGGWTDYIYANGQKIAKATSQEFGYLGLYAAADQFGRELGIPSSSYIIKAADRLYWRQYAAASGGIVLETNAGDSSALTDNNGDAMGASSSLGEWYARTVLLSRSSQTPRPAKRFRSGCRGQTGKEAQKNER